MDPDGVLALGVLASWLIGLFIGGWVLVQGKRPTRDALFALGWLLVGYVGLVLAAMRFTDLTATAPTYTAAESSTRNFWRMMPQVVIYGSVVPATLLVMVASVRHAIRKRSRASFAYGLAAIVALVSLVGWVLIIAAAGFSGARMIG